MKPKGDLWTFVRRPYVLGAAALVVLLLFGVLTDTFRSSRSILRSALTGLIVPAHRTITLNIQLLPADRANATAGMTATGEAVVLDAPRQFPVLDGSGSVRVRRKGVEFIYDLTLRAKDGAFYLKFNEVPAPKAIAERIEGVWIRLSNPQRGPPAELSPTDLSRALSSLLSSSVIPTIDRPSQDPPEGSGSFQHYHFMVNQDAAQRALAGMIEANAPERFVPIARGIKSTLDRFRIKGIDVWVTPRTHDLRWVRVTLIPVTENLKGQVLVGTVGILPLNRAPEEIQAPDGSRKLNHPGLLLKVFSLGQ